MVCLAALLFRTLLCNEFTLFLHFIFDARVPLPHAARTFTVCRTTLHFTYALAPPLSWLHLMHKLCRDESAPHTQTRSMSHPCTSQCTQTLCARRCCRFNVGQWPVDLCYHVLCVQQAVALTCSTEIVYVCLVVNGFIYLLPLPPCREEEGI